MINRRKRKRKFKKMGSKLEIKIEEKIVVSYHDEQTDIKMEIQKLGNAELLFLVLKLGIGER